jgi:hypothetical protein
MTEMRADVAAIRRPFLVLARYMSVRAVHGLRPGSLRFGWRRRQVGSAVCLLVVPSGRATARPAVTLGLVGVTLLVCTASLVGMIFLNREPTLSVRKTLALTAARSLAHDEPAATFAQPASLASDRIGERHSPIVPDSDWTVVTAAETSVDGSALSPSAQMPFPARAPEPEYPFTGIWVANEKACTPQLNREGYLPTIINDQGAWAGETTCAFKSLKGQGSTFIASAVCSDPRKSWRVQVRLTVVGRQLTWKSRSGSRIYTRCDQGQSRTHVAQASPVQP